MSKVTYQIVEHDSGWAYKVGDVLSGAFPTHEAALAAAEDAAQRQGQNHRTEVIQYEDEKGQWHTEVSGPDDQAEAEVEDESGTGDGESRSPDVGADEPLPDGPRKPAR